MNYTLNNDDFNTFWKNNIGILQVTFFCQIITCRLYYLQVNVKLLFDSLKQDCYLLETTNLWGYSFSVSVSILYFSLLILADFWVFWIFSNNEKKVVYMISIFERFQEKISKFWKLKLSISHGIQKSAKIRHPGAKMIWS